MNRSYLISTFISMLAVASMAISCENKNVEEEFPESSCTSETEILDTFFIAQVKPILVAKCYECHQGSRVEAGIDYSIYCSAVASALSGDLLGSIKHETPYSPMPDGATKLPQTEIDKIEDWVTLLKGGTINTCNTTDVSYNLTIKPILSSNGCLGCHGTSRQEAGYDFTIYSDLKNAVVAGRLLGAIKRENGFTPMPEGRAKLSDCEISKVEAWVNAGALEN